MQLENRVKGGNIIGKYCSKVDLSWRNSILQTKSLVLSLMASHCICVLLPQNNIMQRKVWSWQGAVHLQATIQQCTLGMELTFMMHLNVINFTGISPTHEVKPALTTFAKMGSQFPIEINRESAVWEHGVLPSTEYLDAISLQWVTKTPSTVGQRVVEVESNCK